MSTVRLRRLQADYDKLRDYVHKHPRLQLIQAEGEPPERYQLEYRVLSLREQDAELKEVKSHLVEISLPRNYPRTPPQCRMLTPVFHPNIAPHAICIGDHWSAGEPLSSIVARIGELLAYQSYNVKSPLNGEAARWVQHARGRNNFCGAKFCACGHETDCTVAHQDIDAAISSAPEYNASINGSIGVRADFGDSASIRANARLPRLQESDSRHPRAGR
jgi:ubiquitin-protein ligase